MLERTQEKEEFKNSVSIVLSKEEITCPITGEIFFDPVVTSCGHVFEKAAIKSWLEKKKDCPCCKEEVKHFVPDFFLKNQIEKILKQESNLQKEQFFDFVEFHRSVIFYLNEEKDNPEPLKKFVAILSASPEKLNEIREEKGHEGQTAVWCLLSAFIRKGHDFLLNDTIQTLITSEALNSKEVEIGASSVTTLALNNYGQKFLLSHPDLQNKITSLGLNAIIQDKAMQGFSAVFGFAYTAEGRQLLWRNVLLREKINADGLNTIFQGSSYNDQCLGHSAVYELTLTIHTDENARLLLSDPKIQALITPNALNAEILTRRARGYTPLYWLTFLTEGIKLLGESPVLCEKITSSGLNARVQEGVKRETSAVFWLCVRLDGIEVLFKNPLIRKKINPEALNAVIPEGSLRGYSAAKQLCSLPKGRELLRLDPELRSKISAVSLNNPTSGGSGVTFLTSTPLGPEGIEILLLDPQFCAKIDAKGLNAIATEGILPGLSGVYGLCKYTKGHELLLKDVRLRGLMSKEALFSVVSASEDSPDNGKTAADWLLQAKTPESEKLLEDPVLRMKLGLSEKESKILQVTHDSKNSPASSQSTANTFFVRLKASLIDHPLKTNSLKH